jgi:hypothetical protein
VSLVLLVLPTCATVTPSGSIRNAPYLALLEMRGDEAKISAVKT